MIHKKTKENQPDLLAKVFDDTFELDERKVPGVIDLYGMDDTGRTRLALSAAERIIQNGGNVLFCDLKNSLTRYIMGAFDFSSHPDSFHVMPSGEVESIYRDIRRSVRDYDLTIIDTFTATYAETVGTASDTDRIKIARLIDFTAKQICNAVRGVNRVIFINDVFQVKDRKKHPQERIFQEHWLPYGGLALYNNARRHIGLSNAGGAKEIYTATVRDGRNGTREHFHYVFDGNGRILFEEAS